MRKFIDTVYLRKQKQSNQLRFYVFPRTNSPLSTMKAILTRIIALFLIAALSYNFYITFTPFTSAAFNGEINYQGKLTDANNIPVANGNYHMEFQLWKVESGGNEGNCEGGDGEDCLWKETRSTGNLVTVTNGLFSVMLGKVNTNLGNVDFNQTLWLEVKIGGKETSPSWETLTPRKTLGAVPAAFEAGQLDGIDSASFARSDTDDTISGLFTITKVPAGTGVDQGSLYINPASATSDYTLLGLAVGDSEKFRIDEDGDVVTGIWKATAITTTYGGTGQNFGSTAQGHIIYFSGPGVMAALEPGTSGYFLKTQGASADPTWAAVTDKVGPTLIVAATDSKDKTRADYECDGTDDDVTIETAISALPASGGVVYLLEGTYSIGDTAGDGIDIPTDRNNNVAIIGAGRATVLQRANDAASAEAVITVGNGGTTTFTGITIANLAIDGQRATYDNFFYIGIYFNRKVTQSRVQNTWVYDNKGSSIRLDGTSGFTNTDNLIEGNDFRDTEGYGIVVLESDNNTISDNHIQSNWSSDISISASENNTISDNYIDNSIGDYGSLQLKNNSHNNIVAGNVIHEVGGGDDGIIVTDSNNNLISSNRILDSVGGRYGIYISSGSDNYLIGNEILGSGFTAEINDTGTDTTIQHRDWFEIESARTLGTLLSLGIPSSTTLTGALTGTNMDLSTNLTATGFNVTGQSVALPTVTNTGAGTYDYLGLTVSAGGGLTQNTAAGTTNWLGADINLPTITSNFAGSTITAYGLNLAIPDSAVTQTLGTATAAGINIEDITTGPASGTLYGLNIGSIGTPGAGTETAINIGSGWDNDLSFADGSVNIRLTGTDPTITVTDGSNNYLNLTADSTYYTALGYAASVSNSTGGVALGRNASVSNSTDAIALGRGASVANATYAIAIGGGASADSSYSLALGYQASASGMYGIAIGVNASANSQAIALGRDTSTGADATALGYDADVSGTGAIGVGYNADVSATANYSAAFGYGATVGSSTHDYAFVFGTSASSGGANQFIIGNNASYLMDVGIGMNTPSAKVHVAQTDAANNELLILDTEETTNSQDVMTVVTDATADEDTVLQIDAAGNILADNTATATTATTSGTGTDTTTITFTGAAPFATNDILFVNNAGTDYWTRCTANCDQVTITVSPAVTYENAITVTKYYAQNIGTTASFPSTDVDRYFQGYFLGGIVTGSGSTIYSDRTITMADGGTFNFTDGTNTLMSLADAGTTGNLTLTGKEILSSLSISSGNRVSNTTIFNPSAGGTQYGYNLAITNAPTSVANTADGFYSSISDTTTTLGNTLRGFEASVSHTGAVTSDVTIKTYGGYFSGTKTGASTDGRFYTYGVYGSATGSAQGISRAYGVYGSATGADWSYGVYGEGGLAGVLGEGDTGVLGVGPDVGVGGIGEGEGSAGVYGLGPTGVYGEGDTYGVYGDVCVWEAKTTSVYSGYLINTATSSTASINKYGLYITSTGAWTGAGAANYGLYIAEPTGGSSNYGLYIAGGGTNAIFVDAGDSRFDGLVSVGLGSTASTTAVCSSLANATAPTAGTAYELRDCSDTPAADYAEIYPVASDVEPGDLVAPGSELALTKDGDQISKLIKTSKPYQETMIGIASDPTKITDFNVIGYNIDEKDNPQPVSLSGRVKVKVSTENGSIEPGDPLTSSSIPGVAMAACASASAEASAAEKGTCKAGPVVGKALEPFPSTSSGQVNGAEGEIGKIMVFVNVSYYLPEDSLAALRSDSQQPEGGSLFDGFVQKIKQALASLGFTIENGIAQVKELITDKITAKKARIDKLEMVDQVTGETYCTWIEHGQWQKVRASCDQIEYLNGQMIISDSSFIKGCTDSNALNYNPEATADDNSCVYSVEGCTDSNALNYNPEATTDNDSCQYQVEGCIDSEATNYNPEATVDNGSCEYEGNDSDIEGCTDPNALNYNADATVDDSSCEYKIMGCTDPSALNYNLSATENDGSCQYPVEGCTDLEALNYNPEATIDNDSCEYSIPGCTDSNALNYNPSATKDDGSCEYPIEGCIDSAASNYNPEATVDDGSCQYPEPASAPQGGASAGEPEPEPEPTSEQPANEEPVE